MALAITLLAGCASDAPEETAARIVPAPSATAFAVEARIVATEDPLQCVAYARQAGAVFLRGDAWTWWDQAAGLYERSGIPRIGATMVFRKRGRSLGHLAVVTRVIGERLIVADHANWLNQGQIHQDTPIIDVSPANDWSAVRVWYTPGGHWGGRIYPVYGFIHPTRLAES
ncbi:MAG: CHAP domain-containing protein [Rhodospirillaceae bacterium]|nr:CHAP domain-containing protein [Rhodospirillaceae bacterium]MBT6118335.1 CHAP domain-containing protein [Rhodospirillaceae bacterium]